MDIQICAVPTIISYDKQVVGAEDMGISYYAGIPDLRYVGVTKD